MKNLTMFLCTCHNSNNISHNSNLVVKLAPYLNCNSEIIAMNTSDDKSEFPSDIGGVPFYIVHQNKHLNMFFRRSKFFSEKIPIASILYLAKTYSKYLLRKIRRKPHAVISTYQSFLPAMSASFAGKSVVKALYLMDPTDVICSDTQTVQNERRQFLGMLKRYDIVFTTRFIKEASWPKATVIMQNGSLKSRSL